MKSRWHKTTVSTYAMHIYTLKFTSVSKIFAHRTSAFQKWKHVILKKLFISIAYGYPLVRIRIQINIDVIHYSKGIFAICNKQALDCYFLKSKIYNSIYFWFFLLKIIAKDVYWDKTMKCFHVYKNINTYVCS